MVRKVYQALTIPPNETLRKRLREEWTVKNRLDKVSTRSKQSRYGAVQSGGDYAETSFRILDEYPRGLWLEARPKTGRTHQIRVHLSEFGLPILGDNLYGLEGFGKRHDQAPRLMLHAVQLVFPHPVTNDEVSVTSPLPDDFQECLLQCRGGL